MMRTAVIALAALAIAASGTLVGGASAASVDVSTRAPGPTTSDWKERNWCGKRQSVADLAKSYNPRDPKPTLLELAKRRYPPAVPLIEAAPDDRLRQWVRPFPGRKDNFASLQSFFATVVHEEGHMLNWPGANPPSVWAYRVVDDASVVLVPGIEAYPRSEILRRHPDPKGDIYAEAYLLGPLGGQDIEMLVEEFVQYVHTLASGYCGYDIPSSTRVSYREGVLTHMWWMQMYLAVGRKHHPADYRAILANKGMVKVILDTWSRAEYWLIKTRGTNYAINDASLLKRVYKPANLAEIDRLRMALTRR